MLTSCSIDVRRYNIIVLRDAAQMPTPAELSKMCPAEGNSLKFLGIGSSEQKAVDAALKAAGEEYDLLVNPQLHEVRVWLASGYTAKGYAAKSSELKQALGEKGYQEWIQTHNVAQGSPKEE